MTLRRLVIPILIGCLTALASTLWAGSPQWVSPTASWNTWGHGFSSDGRFELWLKDEPGNNPNLARILIYDPQLLDIQWKEELGLVPDIPVFIHSRWRRFLELPGGKHVDLGINNSTRSGNRLKIAGSGLPQG